MNTPPPELITKNKGMSVRALYLLMRPEQWVKNAFIFLPIFFDKKLFEANALIPTIVCFISFCLIASSIYCFNDVLDRANDRLHPIKKQRPIASGELSVSSGYQLMTVLVIVGIFICWAGLKQAGFQNFQIFCCLLILSIYYIQNILYCTILKKYALIDVFSIAIGFLLRLFLGAAAANVVLSQWIVLMTFLLASFLAFAKRRDDVVTYEKTGVKLRNNIHRYNLEFLNQAITVIGTVTIVCYIMYTVSPEVTARFNSEWLYLTSIFVMAGIIRYLQISIVDVRSGSPTKVLKEDRFIQITAFLWILSFMGILYA